MAHADVLVDAGRHKRIMRLKPCNSFFNMFSGPILSGRGANEHDDHEEVRPCSWCAFRLCVMLWCSTTMYQLLNQIDADFEIGLTFKDKIIPRAYTWYTGEAADASSDDDEVRFRAACGSPPC